jgi:hypothetical protein
MRVEVGEPLAPLRRPWTSGPAKYGYETGLVRPGDAGPAETFPG